MGATTLVGRDAQLDALRSAVDAARRGIGQIVLIEGEPGIGKTRLVTTAADAARDDGVSTFVGGFSDLAPARPFGGLVDALDIVTASTDRERAALAALLTDSMEATAVATSVNPGLQYRAVEGITGLVERLAERSPLMLVVEDLHWADVATLVALRSIGRRVERLPVVLVLTWRSGHDLAELHRLSDDLLRADATHLVLPALDETAVLDLVADVLRARPTPDLLARVRGASGNPLFVIEYVRALGSGPLSGSDTNAGEFRSAVLRRLGSLSEQTKEILRVASLLGLTFSPSELAVSTARPMVQLVPGLHEAAASGILEERGAGLAFRHALVRDAIYESIPEALRRELHREIGRMLAEGGADALSVAHHLSRGARTEDPEAVEWLRRAARSVGSRAPATAVELLRRGRELLGPAAPAREGVLSELAIALAWAGHLAEAEALAVEVLDRRPDPAIVGALRCELVYALTWQGKSAAALAHATPAPDERLGDWDAALLRAEAAVASVFAFDFASAKILGAEAGEMAERLGHDRALCHALSAQAFAAVFTGDSASAIEFGQRAVDVADRSANAEAHLAHPRFFFGSLPLVSVNRYEESERLLREGLRIAESLGLAWSFPLYHTFLGAGSFVRGDLDGAIAECETALEVADEVGLYVGFTATAAAWLANAQLHRGDVEAAEETVAAAERRLAQTGPQLGMGPYTAARARLLAARGRRDEAIALLQGFWDLYMASGTVADAWTTTTLIRLRLETGDDGKATQMLDMMAEAAAQDATSALWHQIDGLIRRDADSLRRAAEIYRRDGQVLEFAECCVDAADALCAAGRHVEAASLREDALDAFERVGAERDVARVTALARSHGVKRGSRRTHVRAKTGWDSLTATELKVVGLVAQQLSNPEVAERLFVSRHTVESHLKNVYRKLSLSSRAELAQLALERSG